MFAGTAIGKAVGDMVCSPSKQECDAQWAEASGSRSQPGTLDVSYVYADHLLTPRVLTRASDNKMVWRWDSADPFGLDQPDQNPSKLGEFAYNPRFPGQMFDKETNNNYNYFRDYDPQTGRFVESDPIGLAGGFNTYGYGLGNPISNADPRGLFVPIVIPFVCAAAGCEALFAGGAVGALWWQQSHVSASSGGIIPDQDFGNGVSWPPQNKAKDCRIEVPPPKLPPPQKPDCETLFQVCRAAVKSTSQNLFYKIGGDVGCLTAFAICKKVKDH
jgi:RHS repeat-associated protein